MKRYPSVRLKVYELTTAEIVKQLEQQSLDLGLLALPLNNPSLREEVIFYEDFVVYTSAGEKELRKKYLIASDIDVNRLWLLEEGHCLRSQAINLCELKSKEKELHQLDFETGSIETLKRLVEMNQGITILPRLALNNMTKEQLSGVKYFKVPAPVREIGIVTYRFFLKEKLTSALKDEILKAIPENMRIISKKRIIEL